MRQQFLNMLEQVRTIDIASAPNYRVMKAIATHPEAYFPNPEETAASIQVNVSQDFVDDEELFTAAVEAYVKALSRIYDQLKHDFPPAVADRMWPAFAKQLTQKGGDSTISASPD